MNNKPAGAEFDSCAPYNQPSGIQHLCRYCDKDEILEDISGELTNDEHDEEVDRLMDEAGLCEHCHAEQKADMYRD